MIAKIGSIASLLLLLNPIHPVQAATNAPPGIYLDGKKLSLTTDPVVINGNTLVPMRSLFEAQSAKISWDNDTQTVTANKGSITFTYRIGETAAYKNQERILLTQPGKVINGFTMVPLRFISETLGDLVKWHPYSGDIAISSSTDYETTITYGVNLRASPDSLTKTPVYRMMPKGEKIHVLREIDADWLEVRTQDGIIGFTSAKPLYTDYASQSIAELQADKLIAYGEQYLGTPYEFGASLDQTSTFDCSSFVHHVFKEVLSIDLPRVSYNQAEKGKEVGLGDLRKGDLLFFTARGLDIGHVGIYVGDNRILHTYSKEKGVHFEEFNDKWKKRFVTARRII
ncbi:stalk domain-containing protein [Cohnella silvisoli]|uniref:Stalk domain-containing protein n=1 Tax=Cohnella silvisoli TaxID=2873699 RepID=A0ABV1KTJ8_9BACL|nr:stalk domain-containing protein [Cohnella silvisoli]MCD9022848.1 C40 family peptidase [Cohnella silvisoli]